MYALHDLVCLACAHFSFAPVARGRVQGIATQDLAALAIDPIAEAMDAHPSVKLKAKTVFSLMVEQFPPLRVHRILNWHHKYAMLSGCAAVKAADIALSC